MKKLFILSILALLISPAIAAGQTPAPTVTPAPAPAPAQGGHEYAQLAETTVNYENWVLPNLMTDKPDDLRKLMAGKKLVMIVYFAPWCKNWRYEAPIAAKLYEKYKSQGFQVIGVSEYASRGDVRSYFGGDGPPYPVVTESESKEERDRTLHYTYRQRTGDSRTWGSPWNIFLEPAKVEATGDMLVGKAWVVNGELMEEEVDKFIASKVGGPSASVIQPCKN